MVKLQQQLILSDPDYSPPPFLPPETARFLSIPFYFPFSSIKDHISQKKSEAERGRQAESDSRTPDYPDRPEVERRPKKTSRVGTPHQLLPIPLLSFITLYFAFISAFI